ncbi:MAG: periplasmic heavy metal sensor [Elusimicrobia bacterium]|nr:periplasmic heavy metal sensor [Elusimicrobiota bacterium]
MSIRWSHVLVALALGFALGVGLTCWRMGDRGRGGHERMLESFSSKLALDAEQRTRIDAILKGSRERLEALRARTRPEFDALRKSARDEIRALLKPEQQAEFDRMHERWEQRRMKRRQAKP